jgi:hypothetical protein
MVVGKSVSKTKVVRDMAALAAMGAADVFLRSTRQRAQAEKERAAAKSSLLEWLGDDASRSLPDGRVVSRTSVDFPEANYDRKAYTQVNLFVSPAPAAE